MDVSREGTQLQKLLFFARQNMCHIHAALCLKKIIRQREFMGRCGGFHSIFRRVGLWGGGGRRELGGTDPEGHGLPGKTDERQRSRLDAGKLQLPKKRDCVFHTLWGFKAPGVHVPAAPAGAYVIHTAELEWHMWHRFSLMGHPNMFHCRLWLQMTSSGQDGGTPPV